MFSIIVPDTLEMGIKTKIEYLNIFKGIRLTQLGDKSLIANLNLINGVSMDNTVFQYKKDRNPATIMGEQSVITTRDLFDCNDLIEIGSDATIVEHGSQF
ncbi:MAG: hypothetical protein JEZ06_08495 [Anaerolineaceae bacterium]|nr:hypothetical protein [Anaerolineaceae bacterium]